MEASTRTMRPWVGAQGFYAARLPVTAGEPNFSGAGAPSRLPGTRAMRIAGVASAVCLAVLLGLWFGGDTPALAIALVASGAGLILAACLLADSE